MKVRIEVLFFGFVGYVVKCYFDCYGVGNYFVDLVKCIWFVKYLMFGVVFGIDDVCGY